MGVMDARRRMLALKDHNLLYEAWNLSFDGSSYIDTGVYLFTQENINRDFEFIADGISGNNEGNNTIICAKHNGNAYGFLVRIQDSTVTQYNGTIFINRSGSVVIRRVNGEITLSGTNIKNPTVRFTNAVFTFPLVLGCAIQDDGTPFRYKAGTISHVRVRWL